MYGLIRQRARSESECEVSEARDDAFGSCVGKAFAGAWVGRVADGLGACVLGDVDARGGCGDERALRWGCAERPDDVLDKMGACLKVARWVARCGGDVLDLLGEALPGEVGADRFGGVAADYGGGGPRGPAGGQRPLHACG